MDIGEYKGFKLSSLNNEMIIFIETLSNRMRDLDRLYHFQNDNRITGSSNSKSYHIFLNAIDKNWQEIQSLDPSQKNAMSGIMSKIENFSKSYLRCISYKQMIIDAKPQEFTTGDYQHTGKHGMKITLFEHKIQLILSSLYDCSLQGCNIPTLIREVDKKDIPQIKSGLKEPTFEYIKSLFNFKNN